MIFHGAPAQAFYLGLEDYEPGPSAGDDAIFDYHPENDP